MTNRYKAIDELRSQRWFSGPGAVGAHKHRQIKHAGFSTADFKDKPVIAILSTWPGFQTCHSQFPERIEDVKRGRMADRQHGLGGPLTFGYRHRSVAAQCRRCRHGAFRFDEFTHSPDRDSSPFGL